MPSLSPAGFSLVTNRAQLAEEYPSYPGEVRRLVDQMLDGPADRIQVAHTHIETPVLAVNAIASSIGGRLEGRDGPTKPIEVEDTFAIAAGPVAATGHTRGFVSTLERVHTAEPAETSRRGLKPETLQELFRLAASIR